MIYCFDLSTLESGKVRAVRYPNVTPAGIRADWIAWARSDREVLRLAKDAAYNLWPETKTRPWEAFEVEFSDSEELLRTLLGPSP